jgi:signal transduction histidine kinase
VEGFTRAEGWVDLHLPSRQLTRVLALARADAGDTLVRMDIADIVASRIEVFRARAASRGIDLVIDIEPGAGSVIAGEGAVARVIDELIGNALSYARGVIEIRVTREGSEALVVVSDDGPGVSDGEYSTIFERFARGSRAVPGGSGLGLALVRETARAAGGEAVARRGALGGLEVITRWPRIETGWAPISG